MAQRDSEMFLFDSRFDEQADEYLDHYEVWRLPVLTDEQLNRDWTELHQLAIERLPNLGLRDLPFQVQRRGEYPEDLEAGV